MTVFVISFVEDAAGDGLAEGDAMHVATHIRTVPQQLCHATGILGT